VVDKVPREKIGGREEGDYRTAGIGVNG